MIKRFLCFLPYEWILKKYVPEFKTASQVVTDESNLVDLAAHRLGLAGAFHLAFQGDGDHLLQSKDFWKYLTKLPPVAPFRAQWLYNSHGYSVLGEVLQRVTGKRIDEILHEYVTQPLQLTRTAALADSSLYELPFRQDFRNHFFEAAAGVYTSLNDVLNYSDHVLAASKQLSEQGDNQIAEAGQLFSQHIPVKNPSFRERSYALGWIRTQLPGVVGVMGDNCRIFPFGHLPVLGDSSHPQLTLYHQGATVGYFPSFYLFPETHSAVIVLTNSIANCDAADWIAQVMIESLFELQHQRDWIGITQEFTNQSLQYYENMKKEVQEKRADGPPPRPLDAYTGDYYDSTGIFFIRISLKDDIEGALHLKFQGLGRFAYDLRCFYGDTFEWTLSRNETAKRGRYHQFNQRYFNFHFGSSKKSDNTLFSIDRLEWHHDLQTLHPEVFYKFEDRSRESATF